MATGETKQITGSLTLEDRYQTTVYDDILEIIGATITLNDPTGEIFTDKGNDTVTVTNSTITNNSGTSTDLMFSLGSDNDLLTISNSTLNVSTYTGSGDDEVTIAGTPQSRVVSNKKLSVGAGNDIVTLNAILSGTGNLDFGADNDTLIFNGGTLALSGTVSNLENLTVNSTGGILEKDLTLVGDSINITLNGSLTGTNARKITISDSVVTLNTANNIRQNVAFDIDNAEFTQQSGGTLEIYSTDIAFSADESTVKLHDFIAADNNTGLSGINTDWELKDSNISDNANGIFIKSGTALFQDVAISNSTVTAFQVEEINVTGADVSFTFNKGEKTLYSKNSYVNIDTITFNDNVVRCTLNNLTFMSRASNNWGKSHAFYGYDSIAAGGGIAFNSGTLNLQSATFANNTASASYFVSSTSQIVFVNQDGGYYGTSETTWYSKTQYAKGGAIFLNETDTTIIDGKISNNVAYAGPSTSTGAAGSTIGAYGGGLYIQSGIANLENVVFSNNIASNQKYSYGAGQNAEALGGAIYAINSVINLKNVNFSENIATGLDIGSTMGSSHNAGGAIYLDDLSKLEYTLDEGKHFTFSNNKSQTGGFLFLENSANAIFTIENDALLTIGNTSSRDRNIDSIAGLGTITKNGAGTLTINSSISEFNGFFNIFSGTVQLGAFARHINLSQWDVGVESKLILTQYNDVISMDTNKKIGTIDLGGGSDVINTGGYHLSGGNLLITTLTVSGGGKLSSDLNLRVPGVGFDITLDNVTLASNINGGNASDKITVTQTADLSGMIALGNGANIIAATDSLETTFKNVVTAGSGDDTFTFQNVTFSQSIDLGDGTNSITATAANFYKGVNGGSGNDSIKMTEDSSISGVVDLGGGKNYIFTSKNLDFNGSFKMDVDGETHLIVYNGASLTENALTVYANENDEMVSAYLDWSDIEGLDKVRILVSSDNTFETFEFTVELYNQTKAFTLNLEKGYFIQFQAQDEDGWSHRILTDTEAPDQVTGFVMNGTTAVWDDTHDNWGGNGVKQYNIQVSSTANFNSVIGTYTATDNSYDFSSFADGNYFIRIQAEDYTGNKGEWSNVENLLIDTQAPSKVTVSCSASKDDITVNWNSASDSASGVKEYNIEFSTTSSFATVSKSATVAGTSFSATDLADGTYYIRVQAVDNVGNKGAWSTVSSAIVDTTAPGIVSNVKASQNSGTVSLSWSTANDSGVGVQKYNIQYSTSSNFNTITGSETVTGTSCNIQNLNDGTYYFRVQAVDKNGNIGSWSSSVSAMVDRTAPTTPVNLSVSTGTYNAVLNWSTASDALSGVKEYEYIISSDSSFTSTAFTGKTSDLSKSISSIGYGTYYYKVRAIDNYGNVGNWSDAEIFSIADATKPELTLSGNPANWTNQPVTISANATDTESGIKTVEYSTDNLNWYTGSSVTVDTNGTVYFRATDNDGNVTTKSVSVTKIDTTAPVFEISKNTEALTNQDVILDVTASDSASEIKSVQYSFDNSSWMSGSTVTVDSNKTVYFKVTDNAGNVTEKSVVVDNIDKVAPEKPTASADITSVTNGNVTVSAAFSNDTVSREYSLDNKTWNTYTTGIVMTANGKVYFRGKDEAGNYSTVTSYTVSNIDKVAPAKPEVFASTTAPTNKNVTVNAEFSLDSIKQQYSLDNQTWNAYEDGIVFNRNGIVYFRGIDAAGNISDVTEYRVDNIDKIAPAAPTASANINTLTNGSVIVTVEFSNDTARKEFSYDGQTWGAYNAGIEMTANGTLYFRGKDAAGNYSEITEYEVTNIDKIAPAKPTASANITAATNQSVTVMATFSNDTVTKEYSLDNKFWQAYTAGVVMDANGIVYFRAKDAAGNYSEITEYEVRNIDKTAPNKPVATSNNTNPTNSDVTVEAAFSHDSVVKQYRIGDGEWLDYTGEITVSENGTVYFRAKDAVGNESTGEITVSNIDKAAPEIPSEFTETVSGYDAAFTWTDSVDNAGMSGYCFRYGSTENLDGEGEFVSTNGFALNDLAVGSYYYQVRGVDLAGNMSEWSAVREFAVIPGEVQDLSGSIDGLSWASIAGVGSYAIELTGGSGSLDLETANTAIDFFALPAGTFQWQVKAENGVFTAGNAIVSENSSEPQLLSSEANGDMDLFFGNASGTWEDGYFAEHQGILNGWNGTGEQVELLGKNKISDVFSGSDDANILVLTDDTNGDALFVEDVYTSFGKDAARIAQIDEIRAGAGDDIIDLTSQKFAYDGDGVKICGGLGNDTIWANNGNNTLFGDAGNDRIIGGSGNDVIVGGIGNDSMHGGGGEDIFCFGSDWGVDTVEQLSDGKVTLCFADGEVSNWNADTLTYTDGANSVTVSGVSAENITLNFGNETSLPAGAFSDAASVKIFEDKKQGMLA